MTRPKREEEEEEEEEEREREREREREGGGGGGGGGEVGREGADLDGVNTRELSNQQADLVWLTTTIMSL